MTRLRRAEGKEQTRRLILKAASSHFLRDGFHASSLEQIAEEAGFSTGAVYSNFGGKAELGLEVVEALYVRETEKVLLALAGSADQSLEAWFDIIGRWAETTIGDPGWARFELELAGAMSTREELRIAMANRYSRLREQLTAVVEARSDDLGTDGAPTPETTGTLMLGVILGVALQRAVEPTIPGSILARGLRTIAQDNTPLAELTGTQQVHDTHTGAHPFDR